MHERAHSRAEAKRSHEVRIGVNAKSSKMWTALDGPITVAVDESTFAYHVELDGHEWYSSGTVSLMCNGKEWSSAGGGELVGGKITATERSDARSIQRTWRAGSCGSMTTIVRAYNSGGIEFLSTIGIGGLNGTATCMKTGPNCPSTATGFPSLLLPTHHAYPTGYASWCGSGCGGHSTLYLGTPVVPPPVVDWLSFDGGGIQGGPLITYAAANGSAVVLGPSRSFKSGVMVRTQGTRLVAGAHGMLRSLPAGYTLGFALRARSDGVTGAMLAFGALLRRLAAETEPILSRKLNLGNDVLSRQLHYVTDGGSLLNYCDYWPGCVNDTKAPCRPEGRTLLDLAAYHRSLALGVGVYHVRAGTRCNSHDGVASPRAPLPSPNLAMCISRFSSCTALQVDPFWYSHTPHGGCDDFLARNWSASPFHWPRGLAAAGLPMMLFLAEFAACDDGRAHVIAQSSAAPKEASHTTDSAPRMRQPPGKSSNVYCDDFGFVGSSVGGADAEAFFRARFRENGAGAAGHDRMSTGATTSTSISTVNGGSSEQSVFRALTLDDLQSVWWSSPARLTSASEQSSYDRGLAAAALAYGIPIRVDQQLPGDVLASTLYGARTAARCTADANPRGWFEGVRYRQLAANSLLHRAVGMRPMVDVLWTSSNQSDPRWRAGTICRPNVLYDLVTAVLSTGPVGFGDLINDTDAGLLRRATRGLGDGTILKPASAALPLNRYYAAAPQGGAVITAAPTRPASSPDPSVDAVANSMAELLPPHAPSGEGDGMLPEATKQPQQRSAGTAARSISDDAPTQRPWGWVILGTNVDGQHPSGAPIQIEELWPKPAAGASYYVTFPARTGGTGYGRLEACIDGAPAARCTRVWDSARPLPMGTYGPTGTRGCPIHQFVLASASPVLPSGWAVLGDLRKLVPLSPQRFVVTAADAASPEMLRFRVIGSAGDAVPVTVVTPGGGVRVLNVTVGPKGSTAVSCEQDNAKGYACHVASD